MMETATKNQLEILKNITDARNQLSALYSLFNSSIISAEEYRNGTVASFEEMLDLKNAINQLSNEIYAMPKKDRQTKLINSTGKIKGFKSKAKDIDDDYNDAYTSYQTALRDCLGLKTKLTGDIKALCDEFKEAVDENTTVDLKKGYNNQIKLIKKILAGIEKLRSDYNIKKNNLEAQDPSYKTIRASVTSLLDSLEKSA